MPGQRGLSDWSLRLFTSSMSCWSRASISAIRRSLVDGARSAPFGFAGPSASRSRALGPRRRLRQLEQTLRGIPHRCEPPLGLRQPGPGDLDLGLGLGQLRREDLETTLELDVMPLELLHGPIEHLIPARFQAIELAELVLEDLPPDLRLDVLAEPVAAGVAVRLLRRRVGRVARRLLRDPLVVVAQDVIGGLRLAGRPRVGRRGVVALLGPRSARAAGAGPRARACPGARACSASGKSSHA